MELLFGPILVKQQQIKKKQYHNNNLTIQNNSNYHTVLKSSLQCCDEYSAVASLPCAALCNDQADYDDHKDK
jgi:hypothetical protein